MELSTEPPLIATSERPYSIQAAFAERSKCQFARPMRARSRTSERNDVLKAVPGGPAREATASKGMGWLWSSPFRNQAKRYPDIRTLRICATSRSEQWPQRRAISEQARRDIWSSASLDRLALGTELQTSRA